MSEARCATCKWFGQDGYPYRGWGTCLRLTDGYRYRPDADGPEDGRLAIPWDFEGYSAGIYVSDQFGCVMHEPRGQA